MLPLHDSFLLRAISAPPKRPPPSDLDALGASLHAASDALLHRTAERNTALQLLCYVFCHQLALVSARFTSMMLMLQAVPATLFNSSFQRFHLRRRGQ